MSKEESLDDDSQLVPNDDDDDDDEAITASQEAQLMNVIIPLDDCLDCHVQLTHCQIDSTKTDSNEDVDESEESTWSWKEYFNLFTAAYPSSQEEELECTIAVYDENDFDPAIFLNANMDWIPR